MSIVPTFTSNFRKSLSLWSDSTLLLLCLSSWITCRTFSPRNSLHCKSCIRSGQTVSCHFFVTYDCDVVFALYTFTDTVVLLADCKEATHSEVHRNVGNKSVVVIKSDIYPNHQDQNLMALDLVARNLRFVSCAMQKDPVSNLAKNEFCWVIRTLIHSSCSVPSPIFLVSFRSFFRLDPSKTN